MYSLSHWSLWTQSGHPRLTRRPFSRPGQSVSDPSSGSSWEDAPLSSGQRVGTNGIEILLPQPDSRF